MNSLKVTKEWLNWFHNNNIEAITTIDNRELFEHTIKDKIINQEKNYKTLFYFLKCLRTSFDFLDIQIIRLEHTKEIEENDLQIFRKDRDYTDWEKDVIRAYPDIVPTDFDYPDETRIQYDYYIQHEHKQTLYKFPIYEMTQIYIWDFDNGILEYEINIEMRKILFYHDSYFEFNLPEEILAYNQSLLSKADANFKNMMNNIFLSG